MAYLSVALVWAVGLVLVFLPHITADGCSTEFGSIDAQGLLNVTSGITNITDNAFNRCFDIKSVYLPDSVEVIGSHAFYECFNLTSVTFASNSSLNRISDYAFADTSLGALDIPKRVISLGEYAFLRCSKLVSFTFEPDSALELIEDNAFQYSGLVSFIIPKSVTTIQFQAFYLCAYLTSITFEDGCPLLDAIPNFAFYGAGLTSISIPPGIKSIGQNAFNLCLDLASVTFEEDSQLETISTGAFFSTGLINIEIPRNVTSMGQSVLSSCDYLTTVTFQTNSSLETIPSSAFYNSSLTAIEIPLSVVNIYGGAFGLCFHLTSVTFEMYNQSGGTAIKNINSQAFAESGLTSFYMPPSVVFLGDHVFYKCLGLKTVNFSSVGELQSIPNNAFELSGLETIHIPNTINSIGDDVFLNCNDLTTVVFASPSPSTLTIGSYAFLAPGLTKGTVTIQEDQASKINAIGTMIYMGVVNGVPFAPYGLIDESGNLQVSNTVTSIGEEAFLSCSDLLSVTYESGSVLHTIAEGAFETTGLVSVVLPKSLKVIGTGAFYNCFDLTSVTFEDDSELHTIGFEAFYDIGISSIEIPQAVSSIGLGAFSLCYSLGTITFLNRSSLVTFGDGALAGVGQRSGCGGSCGQLTVILQPAIKDLIANSKDLPQYTVFAYNNVPGNTDDAFEVDDAMIFGDDSESSSNVGLIAGAVVGAVVGVGIAAYALHTYIANKPRPSFTTPKAVPSSSVSGSASVGRTVKNPLTESVMNGEGL